LCVLYVNAQDNITSPHGSEMKIACETCHTTLDWNDVPQFKFNHDQVGYPLLGEHKFAECRSCHISLVFNQVGINCGDCHTDIHKGELGNRCESCHNSKNWENRQQIFEDHNQTNFPLVGVHANLDCESCHINEQQRQFANLSVECQSCHMADYMSTLSPSHQKTGFDLDCQKCHLLNATVWEASVYEHPLTFPLNGGHSGLDCADCHVNGFGETNTDCYACHQQDYDLTNDPNHKVFGFLTVCEQCHNGVSWEGTTFDHFAESGFAIEGAHQNILCVDCHVNNELTGIARECVGCHQQDYNNVMDPNHVQNNFELDCTICHNQNAWVPADFDHSKTQFPLTGAHITVNCTECHSAGYENIPTDCFACHEQDYDNTTDPNHNTAQFPNICEDCHSTTAWTPTSWDHDDQFFPIYSGKHREAWDACADCHVNANDYKQFECINCHEHRQSKMDDEHKEENDYVWESQACYECHPDGRD